MQLGRDEFATEHRQGQASRAHGCAGPEPGRSLADGPCNGQAVMTGAAHTAPGGLAVLVSGREPRLQHRRAAWQQGGELVVIDGMGGVLIGLADGHGVHIALKGRAHDPGMATLHGDMRDQIAIAVDGKGRQRCGIGSCVPAPADLAAQ